MLTREEMLFIEADLKDHVHASVACRDCKHRLEIASKVADMRRLTYGVGLLEEA